MARGFGSAGVRPSRREAWRYVVDIMIILIRGLMRHPLETYSAASQLSRSGCVGALPDIPRFSEVDTIPSPVRCCHVRLATTRAAKPAAGVPRVVSQRARAERRPLLSATGFTNDEKAVDLSERTLRNPGLTSGPGVLNSPRSRRWVAGGGPTS